MLHLALADDQTAPRAQEIHEILVSDYESVKLYQIRATLFTRS
jgi:hypothetical protein